MRARSAGHFEVAAGLFALGAPAGLVGALTGVSVGLSSEFLPDKPV